jgi:esterase/lipase/1-acyl-sn-glycerol-3-phosphate acyltransferase
VNNFAYLTTGIAIKAISELSKTNISIHGEENIPQGAKIYVINHFTRIETLFLPYHINKLTGTPVWSLADAGLFAGRLGGYLNKVGALSTQNPDRDLLIVKSLLTGEASWVIFPEGRMVKSKKIYEKGQKKGAFMVESPDGKHRPHTGAAALALRTEFYRERIREINKSNPDEVKRLQELFHIDSIDPVIENDTYIVPVNITYYPIRAKENLLSKLAETLIDDMPDRMVEEIMTEGTMLLSGVDADIRFGEPIKIEHYMKSTAIQKDISSDEVINFDDPISSKKMMQKSATKIMERYMSSIYSLTTVNADHLFASILRFIPFREIDEMDLRRRVFLATTKNFNPAEVYRHQDLDKNHIHLITDDRYRQFENFLSIAVEKGVIEKKDNMLVKGESFCSPQDFHTTRSENPVAVITNEVEPLRDLQENLRNIASQSSLRIKEWVIKYLKDKSHFDYEKDYTNFYIEGESKEIDVGMPYFLKGRTNRTGILLIHGYMAAPLEVKGLSLYLNDKGYYIYAPRLNGHGTSPEDLAEKTYMDWVESVEEGYIMMRHMCDSVIIGGFSTGAGLALDLATRVNDASGVFAVSPPMKLHDLSSKLVPAVNTWNKLMAKVRIKKAQKEFVANSPENPHINYSRNPVSGIIELDRLMKSIEPMLPNITIPAMVIQGFGDPVVNPTGSRKIYSLLGSKDKEYLLINFDRHGILLGEGSERVYKAIGDFIQRLGL